MSNILEDAIRTLDQLGVATVLLPFFLIFTLVFAILQKVKVLGDDSKKYNIIIAFVAGMAVVFPHVLYTGSRWDVVPLINQALPWVMVLLVVAISIALVAGLATGKSMHDWSGNMKGIFSIVAIVAVIYIFLAASNNLASPHWLQYWLYNRALVNTIIALVVFVVVIGFITGSDDSKKKGFVEKIGDLFGNDKH